MNELRNDSHVILCGLCTVFLREGPMPACYEIFKAALRDIRWEGMVWIHVANLFSVIRLF